MSMTKKIVDLKFAMKNDEETLINCLLKVYENQTSDEQYCGMTQDHNKVGFNANDAEFLTSVAKTI